MELFKVVLFINGVRVIHSLTRPPTRVPTFVPSSAPTVDYSCVHATSWLVNTNSQYSNTFSSLVDVQTSKFVNVTTATTGWKTTFTGIPFYGHVFTTAEVASLNARPEASSDFYSGQTTAVAGNYYDFGDDIGYKSTQCTDGYWPSGPTCPSQQNGTYTFPVFPSPETGDCYVTAHVGYFVNGVPFWSWSDTENYNDNGVWYNLAMKFEQYDMDVCVGHSAQGTYHHHSVSPCLMTQLNDTGHAHSPVHGFGYDGYPVYGPYQAANTLAVSCWQARDYSDSVVGCSDGKRSCTLVDAYDYTKGTTTASSSGPDPSGTVSTQSGQTISAASGCYFQDMFFNDTCSGLGEEYLDSHNGHTHGSYGYHYHATMDSSGVPTFPYTLGPRYYGCQPNGGNCQTSFYSGVKPSVCTTNPTQKSGSCTKYQYSPAISYPTMAPTLSSKPTSPTVSPTPGPTTPTVRPTRVPSAKPTTIAPSCSPSSSVTKSPSLSPTLGPSNGPTASPSLVPSASPSLSPSASPTTLVPSNGPTVAPSLVPSASPSLSPSASPTTLVPSNGPTLVPSLIPTASPSLNPSSAPTTLAPSVVPSVMPSAAPTSVSPTMIPTSVAPSQAPSLTPSLCPSQEPTLTPSMKPTVSNPPTESPTIAPSRNPTTEPSNKPTAVPTLVPSQLPSVIPSLSPSAVPTVEPSFLPTEGPTLSPSVLPSLVPSLSPSVIPSVAPSDQPTEVPTTTRPTLPPSVRPSRLPSESPSARPSPGPGEPTYNPTLSPSLVPSQSPSYQSAPVLSFSTSTTMSGVTSDSLDESGQAAFVNATASSLGISTDYVNYTGCSVVVRRRLLKSVLTTYTLIAYADVVIPLIDFDDDSVNASALFITLKSSLDSAVTNGDFIAYLTAASILYESDSTLSVTVVSHTVNGESVVNAPSFQPSHSPVTAGSEGTSKSSGLTGTTLYLTIGLVGGGGLLLIIAITVWCVLGRGQTYPSSNSAGANVAAAQQQPQIGTGDAPTKDMQMQVVSHNDNTMGF